MESWQVLSFKCTRAAPTPSFGRPQLNSLIRVAIGRAPVTMSAADWGVGDRNALMDRHADGHADEQSGRAAASCAQGARS